MAAENDMSDLKKMSKGRSAWKGVEHAQNAPEFTQWVGDEFPHRKDLKNLDRRDFLKLTAGSLALAGLASGCRLLPQTKIVVRSRSKATPSTQLRVAAVLPSTWPRRCRFTIRIDTRSVSSADLRDVGKTSWMILERASKPLSKQVVRSSFFLRSSALRRWPVRFRIL